MTPLLKASLLFSINGPKLEYSHKTYSFISKPPKARYSWFEEPDSDTILEKPSGLHFHVLEHTREKSVSS